MTTEEFTNKKIGCFSDIHLGLGQDDKKWHDIALDFAKWASDIYKSKGIYELVIPGDIFHNRNMISVETLSVAKKFFDYFKDFDIYISTGNHDSFLKENSEINSISLLDGWNNIRIIDKIPMVVKTPYNKNICLVPWGTLLHDIPKSDIIFGHFEISSFYMNSYKVCEHGFESSDMFQAGRYIISGHFHKKDHRKYKNGEILYLGSPYQQNFGDCMDERGIYVFDLEDETFEFIKNDISPEFVKIKVTNEKDLKEKNIKNNFVSITIDNKIDEKELLNIKNKIYSFNPTNLRVEYDEKDSINSDMDEEKDLEASDLFKSIEEYIKTLDIENKKEVVDYIKEMYNSLI